MSNVKKGLFFGVLFASLVLGFLSMKRAMPQPKEERIYKELKVYMPYKLEKYVGGLEIVDKRNDTKEKPSAAEVFLRLDELEKEWGHKHLKIEGSTLVIMGENNLSIGRLSIKTPKEQQFLNKFFGIQGD